jgi:hypothetical protein
MLSWSRDTLLVLAAAAFVACLAGCAEEPQRPAIKWRQGQGLPADFPKDVPVYPNAQLKGAITGEGLPTEEGAYLAWTTKDEIPAVRHFYQQKLDEEGWHVVSYPGVPVAWMGEGGVTVVGTKWGRTVSFGIATKDGATMINLVFPAKG